MRIGGGSPEQLLDRIMEPIVGMDETEGLGGPLIIIRNKAQFPIGIDKDGNDCNWLLCGQNAFHFISNTNCALGVED